MLEKRADILKRLPDEEYYLAESIYDIPLQIGSRFYASNFDGGNPPVKR